MVGIDRISIAIMERLPTILGVVLVASLLTIAAIMIIPQEMDPGGPPNTIPQCALSQQDPSNYTFVISDLTYSMEWRMFSICVLNEATHVSWNYEPRSELLTSPEGLGQMTQIMSPSRTENTWAEPQCVLTDVGGNGGLNNGDFFTIDMDVQGVDPGTYTAKITYAGTTTVGAITFHYP